MHDFREVLLGMGAFAFLLIGSIGVTLLLRDLNAPRWVRWLYATSIVAMSAAGICGLYFFASFFLGGSGTAQDIADGRWLFAVAWILYITVSVWARRTGTKLMSSQG